MAGVVAGGPDDYMEVRHLVLRGTDAEMGRQLAVLARDRHGVVPATGGDPVVTRARRQWYQVNWPSHFGRMTGVAAALGLDPDDDEVELGLLAYLGAPAPACSVAWLPPRLAATGHGTLSRDYDFATGTLTEILGGQAQPGELPTTARPYVLETYPDGDGHACLLVYAYELLGGCLDGVNDAGVVVALLADDESGGGDPTLAPAAGLNEVQVLRFVLETCASAAEARVALLGAKQHTMFVPCHFLVADASGDSFVWERTANREFVIDGGGDLQVVTNHLLHGRTGLEDLPADDGPSRTYARARALTGALSGAPGPLSTDAVKAAHACVHRNEPGGARTLWHALYDGAERSLEVSFYLGDDRSGRVRRSPYLRFALS